MSCHSTICSRFNPCLRLRVVRMLFLSSLHLPICLMFILPDCNSEQDAARVLGHTQTSWDNDSGRERQPASEDKDWFQLTDRERAAALRLGFNRGMWDGLATGPQPATADMAWSELRDRERAAAAALGYSQRTWDNESGFERQPSTENKSWDELTSNEQTAAGVLGYNRRSWDGPQPRFNRQVLVRAYFMR